jgi:hypothetical protein
VGGTVEVEIDIKFVEELKVLLREVVAVGIPDELKVVLIDDTLDDNDDNPVVVEACSDDAKPEIVSEVVEIVVGVVSVVD